jgi:hypothetical protein
MRCITLDHDDTGLEYVMEELKYSVRGPFRQDSPGRSSPSGVNRVVSWRQFGVDVAEYWK